MSLKDDIEAVALFARCFYGIAKKEKVDETLERVSRIEAALACNDGPPEDGDVVFWIKHGEAHADIAKYELLKAPIVLMRRAEVERRIKEGTR